MKKILAAVSSLALALSVSVAVPAPAMADNGANDVVGFCKWINSIAPEYTVGNCVSDVRANNGPVQYCKWAEPQWWFSYVWENQGDCVSDLRQY